MRRLLVLAACCCPIAACGDEERDTTTSVNPAPPPVPSIAELEAGQGQEGLAETVECRKTGARDFTCDLEFPDKPDETRQIHVEDDGELTIR